MLKRLIIAAVGVVGLVVIGLGIASATVWRADDVLVATTSGGPHTLVTEPGVLELGGDPVTVRVSVPDDGPVVLAVGRDTDVAGWVGTDAHGTVTGLSGWHTLAVDDVAAPAPTPAPTDEAAAPPADAATPAPSESAAATPAPAADPTGSDLWVAEVTGTGTAELEWPAQEGRWSLLAVSTGKSAPTLALEWPRVVTTPWLWPCVVVGALLVMLAGWLLLRDVRRRRAGLDEPVWHPVNTGAVPTVSVPVGDVDAVPVLTRRQLREAEQARAAKPRTGSVPRVPAPTASDTGQQAAVAPASETTSAPAASAAPAATSRRALRPPTGSVPTVSTPPASPAPASPGWTPATSGAASPVTPATSGAGSPVTAPANPSAARPLQTGSAPGQSGNAPSKPGTTPAPSAASQPTTAPSSAETGQSGTPPHGRPSWAHAATAPVPTPSAPAPDPQGPAAWSAVPPPPGARLRPGSPSGPDAEPVHAGRPTWIRPTTQPTPPAEESTAANSRADAWRKAWGLPPTDADAATAAGAEGAQPTEDTNKEDGR